MKNKILILAACLFVLGTVSVQAQIENKNIIAKPPTTIGIKPKVALNGAVGYERDGKQYHKIILIVTNRDKYSAKMFGLGEGEKLPPNPCRNKVKTRIVMSVFGEDDKQIASCLAISSAQALERPSFLVEKGKIVPEFVYIVLTDLKTGATNKSNLVSPFGGETK